MSLDRPFDRRLRRIRRDRSERALAKTSGDGLYLHRLASDELVERLGWVKRSFTEALVIGASDEELPARLRSLGIRVTICDPGGLFALRSGVQCEEDRLPFADSAFDLIVSVGLLDSVNDLPGALSLIRRALRPDGLFLAAFAGAGSLPRLRSAMLAADEAENVPASPRIHPQIDVRAAGDLLVRAGFALPVVDCQSVTIRFPSFQRLVADLRLMASTNMLAERSTRPVGRLGLAAAIANFRASADPDGKTGERFDILYLIGWAPSPEQPRPARRGSASRSLADVLPRRS